MAGIFVEFTQGFQMHEKGDRKEVNAKFAETLLKKGYAKKVKKLKRDNDPPEFAPKHNSQFELKATLLLGLLKTMSDLPSDAELTEIKITRNKNVRFKVRSERFAEPEIGRAPSMIIPSFKVKPV